MVANLPGNPSPVFSPGNFLTAGGGETLWGCGMSSTGVQGVGPLGREGGSTPFVEIFKMKALWYLIFLEYLKGFFSLDYA